MGSACASAKLFETAARNDSSASTATSRIQALWLCSCSRLFSSLIAASRSEEAEDEDADEVEEEEEEEEDEASVATMEPSLPERITAKKANKRPNNKSRSSAPFKDPVTYRTSYHSNIREEIINFSFC